MTYCRVWRYASVHAPVRGTCLCACVAEAFVPSPSISTKIKVYASHAFSDRERVENVMKQYVP